MRYQHPLGRAGRAGGIHDVGHRIGAGRRIRVVCRHRARWPGVQVQTLRARIQGFSAVGQHQHRLAVLHHEGLTLLRGIDVQRYVDSRTLEHSKLAEHQVDGAWQQQRDAVPRLHAQLQQFCRQTVGLKVQLVVTQSRRIMRYCRGLRRALSLSLE